MCMIYVQDVVLIFNDTDNRAQPTQKSGLHSNPGYIVAYYIVVLDLRLIKSPVLAGMCCSSVTKPVGKNEFQGC